MVVEIKCTSHIRELVGKKKFFIQIEEAETGVTTAEVLRKIEMSLGAKSIALLKNGAIVKGLLVFRRNTAGGLDRIRDCHEMVANGESLTLGTGMEGG